MYGYRRTSRDPKVFHKRSSKALKIGDDYVGDVVQGFRTLNVSGRETLSNTVDIESLRYRGVVRETGLPPRTIEVQYQLTADTSTELLKKFKLLRKCLTTRDYFNQDGFVFSFDDEPASYYGYLSNMETPEANSTHIISSFTLICPEPWKLGELKITGGDVPIDTFYPTVPELIQVEITEPTNTLEIKSGEYNITFDPEKTTLSRGDVVKIFPQEGLVFVGDKRSEHLISLTSDFQNFEIFREQTVTVSGLHVLSVLMRERWL